MSRAFTTEDLLELRRLGDLDCSPDGRWLVACVDEISSDGRRYETNLYRFDLRETDAPGVALTSDGRRKSQPRFRADGLLGYLAQPDAAARAAGAPELGDEESGDDAPLQLHLLALDGGAPRRLTGHGRGVGAFAWAKDRLVLLAPVSPKAEDLEHDAELLREERDRKDSALVFDSFPIRFWDHWLGPAQAHLLVGAPDGSGLRDLTPGIGVELEETSFDVSPDGRHACVEWWTTTGPGRPTRDLVLIDLEDGARRELTSGDDRDFHEPRFSPDGTRLACTTQPSARRVTGKVDLATIPVAGGEHVIHGAEVDLWPGRPRWIDDERILYGADDRGRHLPRIHSLADGTDQALADSGCHRQATAVGDEIVTSFSRVDAPAELVALPIAGGEARRLSALNDDKLADVALSSARFETFEGANGREVQAIELRPPDFDESKTYPLCVWIHGGPLHAYTDEFHYRWNPQVHAAPGRIILMVNPAGSTGFGQQHVEDNNGEWGGTCFEDIMAATETWAARDHVDDGRMAALGASFGGYMVNWIAGHSQRFRCLVSHAGLYHLHGFHGVTDLGPAWEDEFEGPPWEGSPLYERWSPSNGVKDFATPTLVIHGEKDYRVPLGEGLQVFQALQSQGVRSRLVYFPDENHWILKPGNMALWNAEVLAWLDEFLA
ncbi:MAG: S9 family peptidase [Acidobacteriota bacterium]